MSDVKPETQRKASSTFAAFSHPPDPPPSAAVRHRVPQRQRSGQNASPSPQRGVDHRRSSMLSFSSIEEVTQSLSGDLINPTMSRADTMREDAEVTHWHSTPLAFAILPAFFGVLFKNGSAVVTDILLLGLAAIFMNWSVRLPWDWYYSAQAQLRTAESAHDGISDDVETDETAVESASPTENLVKDSDPSSHVSDPELTVQHNEIHEQAAAELRRQETLALLATFVFPLLAACLLHAIRFQLTTSSTALVSDFNLTIFALAAEIRPCQQLIRLVRTRTLHLQRVVTGLNDPFGAAVEESDAIKGLASRVADLEARLVEQTTAQSNGSVVGKVEVAQLVTAELKKRSEPRFHALERAMRLYEKRSATLNMLIEQRLNTHESRIQDSVSLAAAAAQQANSRGAVATFVDSVWSLILAPLRLGWSLFVAPLHAFNSLFAKLEELLLGRSSARPAKRSSSRNGIAQDGRPKDKVSSRKVVR